MSDGAPGIGVGTGGSLVEWNRSLDGVLKLDFDMAIAGRGEPHTRAEVQAFRDKGATLITRITDAIKAGATKDTLASQVKTDDLGWMFRPNFFNAAYDEITQKGGAETKATGSGWGASTRLLILGDSSRVGSVIRA